MNNKHNVSEGGGPVMHPSLTHPDLFKQTKIPRTLRYNAVIPENFYRRSERDLSSIHNDLMDPSKYSRSAKLKNMSSIKMSKWTKLKNIGSKSHVRFSM